MIRLVLFDIDGTLIRTDGAGERAFDRVCESIFGIKKGTAHLNFAGRTDTSIVRDFFAKYRIPAIQENFNRFFAAYVFWLDQLLSQSKGRILPGVRELIDHFLRQSAPPLIGLLTGNIRLGAEIKLRHHGLWDLFEMGAFGDDHEDRNRLAAIARNRGSRLLKRKLKGEQILVVGDTPRDIECARAIEARALVAATGGYSLEELRRWQPNWAVPSLEQVSVNELAG